MKFERKSVKLNKSAIQKSANLSLPYNGLFIHSKKGLIYYQDIPALAFILENLPHYALALLIPISFQSPLLGITILSPVST